MTTANVDGFIVETAVADTGTVNVDGIAAEILVANPTPAIVDGIVAEVLVAQSTPAFVDGIVAEILVANPTPALVDAFIVEILVQGEGPPPPPLPKPPLPPGPIKSTPLASAAAQQPFPPVPTSMTSWYGWNQAMARTINLVLSGKSNNTLANFTLSANSTTTTLRMSQIGPNSVIKMTPLTPSAAEESWYVSNRKNGEATITHSDNPSTDRAFSVMVVA